MSGATEPTPEQIDQPRLRQIIADIDQKRIDMLRKEQKMRYEPLKFLLSGLAAGAGLVGASVVLAAFFLSRIH